MPRKHRTNQRTHRRSKTRIISNQTEKLQKVLARAGLGSRRAMEQWIIDGRIMVNKTVAELGCRVTMHDSIRVDGRQITVLAAEEIRTRVLIYNKPQGEVCTRSDPEGRATVFQNLPAIKLGRWINVGRLDYNTSGLLLFTNNGELANALMKPNDEIERVYAVRILGIVDKAMLTRLQKGVRIEDGLAKFNKISEAGGEGANTWFHVTLCEGRNREVRRLWESQNVQVSRLIRIRFADIALPRYLRRGHCSELGKGDVAQLLKNTSQ